MSTHQGVRPVELETESVEVIGYFVRESFSKWLLETELLLVFYDRANLLAVIK